MFHPRLRRASLALAATISAAVVLSPVAMAAPGDLPDLEQSAPTNIVGGYFDDHSIGGDNHLGLGLRDVAIPSRWPSGCSRRVHNPGAGALGLCGYPAGRRLDACVPDAPGVARDVPGIAPATGASGWFRYATANHSSDREFNRWHAMDLQRFALVPLPSSLGGPAAGDPTFWDTTGARA